MYGTSAREITATAVARQVTATRTRDSAESRGILPPPRVGRNVIAAIHVPCFGTGVHLSGGSGQWLYFCKGVVQENGVLFLLLQMDRHLLQPGAGIFDLHF